MDQKRFGNCETHGSQLLAVQRDDPLERHVARRGFDDLLDRLALLDGCVIRDLHHESVDCLGAPVSAGTEKREREKERENGEGGTFEFDGRGSVPREVFVIGDVNVVELERIGELRREDGLNDRFLKIKHLVSPLADPFSCVLLQAKRKAMT